MTTEELKERQSKGAKKRWENINKTIRSEHMRKAVQVRWEKYRNGELIPKLNTKCPSCGDIFNGKANKI